MCLCLSGGHGGTRSRPRPVDDLKKSNSKSLSSCHALDFYSPTWSMTDAPSSSPSAAFVPRESSEEGCSNVMSSCSWPQRLDSVGHCWTWLSAAPLKLWHGCVLQPFCHTPVYFAYNGNLWVCQIHTHNLGLMTDEARKHTLASVGRNPVMAHWNVESCHMYSHVPVFQNSWLSRQIRVQSPEMRQYSII